MTPALPWTLPLDLGTPEPAVNEADEVSLTARLTALSARTGLSLSLGQDRHERFIVIEDEAANALGDMAFGDAETAVYNAERSL